jgi:STE24 endopeptidase
MSSPPGIPGPRARWATFAAVAAGAFLFAFLVARLLGPGSPPLDSGTAALGDYFAGPFEAAESGDYRSRARLIAIGALFTEFLVLGLLAFYRGSPVGQALERASRRPVTGAAAIGAGLVLTLWIAGLPFSLAFWDLGRDFGLVNQGIGGWAGDRVMGLVITTVIGASGAAVAMLAWRRLRRWFWVAASGVAITFAVVWIWLWPVLVSPLFNDTEPLPEGPLRAEVMRLAAEAGVDVGEVYTVDASRRSAALNAYVHGIGPTKRVVLYDNVVETLPGNQVSSLVAHELAHIESRDVLRGLAFAALTIPLAALALQLGVAAVLRRTGDRPDGPAVILPLALGLALATLLISIPGNQLSREVELTADYRALELTDDPDALIGLQRRITLTNLSEPDPPAVWHRLFGTHPGALRRIGLAEAWKEQPGRTAGEVER